VKFDVMLANPKMMDMDIAVLPLDLEDLGGLLFFLPSYIYN
jgi:hypothetical protein